MGCGSARWASFGATRVKPLNCNEPSAAIGVARTKLACFTNVDFLYTAAAIRSCLELRKPVAPLLHYLCYVFDNHPAWFRATRSISNLGKRLIYRLTSNLKRLVTDFIAGIVYWPLACMSGLLELLQISAHKIPLSYYRNHTFFTKRTDARDRVVTPLDERFTLLQIAKRTADAGLINVQFSQCASY
jgi:hypothetical protein